MNSQFKRYFKIGEDFHQHRYNVSYNNNSIMTLLSVTDRSCTYNCEHENLGKCPGVSLQFEFSDGELTRGCPFIDMNDLRTYRVDDVNCTGLLSSTLNDLLE